MNERIKQLAEQSYKEVIETHDYNGSAYTVREFDQEKFAELLIKDVCKIIKGQNLVSEFGLSEWDNGYNAANKAAVFQIRHQYKKPKSKKAAK